MISVIVPVYKVEQYLPKCIESIINQTYRDIEILLVDDGTPDNSGKICDEYANKDKRIRVFHKKNGGVADARNFGIINAKGKYITLIDSDDWIEPDMLETMVNLAEKKQAEIVICGFFYEYAKGTVKSKTIEKDFEGSVDVLKALVNNNGITNYVWNKLFRKECFKNFLFPVGHWSEDTSTVCKLLANSAVTVSTSKPLYHYRKDVEGSYTKSQSHNANNLIDFWKAHKSRYDYFLEDGRFNIDQELLDKQLNFCALAIARIWIRYWAFTQEEKEKYTSCIIEMQSFCNQKFPAFGIKNWPLSLKVPIFIGRFNNKLAFALLYYTFNIFDWLK